MVDIMAILRWANDNTDSKLAILLTWKVRVGLHHTATI